MWLSDLPKITQLEREGPGLNLYAFDYAKYFFPNHDSAGMTWRNKPLHNTTHLQYADSSVYKNDSETAQNKLCNTILQVTYLESSENSSKL